MIPGYSIGKPIRQDDDWQLLRGVRTRDNLPVLIKAARSQPPRPGLSAQLESEFGTLQSLRIPGVLKAHDLLLGVEAAAMVLEDPGGQLLSASLASGRFGIGEFLRTAVQMAGVIADLHKREIVHTQLRPDVFILAANSDSVWVSGLEHARPSTAARNVDGSVTDAGRVYLAPEQTGRIDASVDVRTDLYLLGLIFYEMLTGRRPFISDDPLELIHCQLARVPKSPSELDPEIPDPLSDIVMRLLRKRADERYLSARGLLADLHECRAQFRRTGAIGELTIASHDRPEQFNIPERLYGREQESNLLLQAFRASRDRGPGLVLVAGYSGVGKTSLIRRIREPVASQRGYFVCGKYDQLERSNPYSAILQAFLELVRQILTEPDTEIQLWRDRILEALGVNAQVVIEVIPELELILGAQPAVPELKPVEAQNRFNFYFQKFIGALARPERPLVLFLDDLQWASVASIRLLQSWVTGTRVAGLLVIGAYRDNEVDAKHPLTAVIRELRESGDVQDEITLQPLDIDSIGSIVRDTVMRPVGDCLPLARSIHTKTDGNPFFARAFLRTLYEEGILTLGEGSGWCWDIEAVNSLRAAENVVELMAHTIEQLPEPTRDVLKVAACIGGKIEPRTLSTAYGRDIEETLRVLDPAMERNLIERRRDGTLSFYHDRVQEAAYGLIHDEDRAPLHYQIGTLLKTHANDDELEELLFEVVNHLNLGEPLISGAAERRELAALGLRAGLKAKLSTAYGSAYDYFTTGVSLLSEDAWESDYDLAFDLHREQAECAYLCGEFEQAEAGFSQLMERARSNRDKGVIYNLRMVQYENMSRFPEAAALGLDAVALFGIRFPVAEEEKLERVDREIELIQQMLGGRSVSALAEMQSMRDADVRILMKLLMTMWAPNYISGDIPMTMLIAASMVRLSLQHGNTSESAYGYITHGINVAARTGDYARAYEFGRLALRVNEELEDLTARAKVNHMFSCYIALWRRHIKDCFRYSRAGYDAGIESGDFTYGGYSGFHESWHALFSAMPLDRFVEEYSVKLQFLSGYKYQSIGDAHQLMLQWGRCLQGSTDVVGSFDGCGFSEQNYHAAYKDSPFFISFYYVAKLHVACLTGDHQAALRYAESAETVIYGVRGMIWEALHCFYHSLALASVFESLDESEKHDASAKLDAFLERMKAWAENSPQNFSHQRDLVRAEIHRIRGEHASAQACYESAIESARIHGFADIEALAGALAGRALLGRGRRAPGAAYLEEAAEKYREWGAHAVATSIVGSGDGGRESAASRASETTNEQRESVDAVAILQACQAIASEMIVDRLVERLMRITLESAGAERAILLSIDGDAWGVDATGEVDAGEISVIVASDGLDETPRSSGVINYVARTQEYLLSDDAQNDDRLLGDAYFRQNPVKSVLCVPIVHRNQMSAMLYLENNLIPNAFSRDRVLLVQALAAQTAIALNNAKLYSDVIKEIAERRQVETALRVIASGTSSVTGEDFFLSLVQSLAQSLQVKCILVSECVGPDNRRVRTLAFFDNGDIGENFEYDVAGTPCERVVGGEMCNITSGLEEQYPVEAGFQSYLGVPAVDVSGKVLGHLAILDKTDMSHLPHAESILKIFATRVGVELNRKRIQEELRASEEKYRLLVDNQTDLVVKLDRAGRLQFVSPSFCEKFSLTEEGLLDTVFHARVHPSDRVRVEQEWAKLHSDPWVAQFEHRARCASGECWLGWALRAVRDEHGDVVEIVGVGRDVTARRQAEDQARKNLYTLAHAGRLQSMGEMASTLAHELNQPLTAILSFSQASQRFIGRQDFDRKELEFALERIAVNAKRAGDIISHMRGFIRKEEPRTELADVNQLVREAIEMVSSELHHREIGCALELGESLSHVPVDPVQIQQVILNLVRNSMEAISGGNSAERNIVVSTRRVHPGAIELAVSDTGPGLDKDVAQKVFDAFVTTKPEGMGIGLSICKSIIEAHDSELIAENRLAGGALFRFVLHTDCERGEP